MNGLSPLRAQELLAKAAGSPTFTAYVIEHLPAKARKDFDFWRALCEPLLALKRGAEAELVKVCLRAGVSYRTARKRFYRARKHGLLGLVNLALCGRQFWNTQATDFPAVKECKPLLELWKRLCEESNRSCVTAHKELVKLWQRRDPEIAAIPAYRDFPGWPTLPPGWGYDNLIIYAPSDYELAAARQGRGASIALRPTVYTTRAGLWVGAQYMFDDKWHDYFVNSFTNTTGRPLEIYSFDVFSACKRRWGVRIREKIGGKYAGLPEMMMRYVLAATLHLDGYSPRGTVCVTEAGTAKIQEALRKILHDRTGGLVTVDEGKTRGDAALMSQYPGLAKGNFRHKAALESNNNLEHNRFDRLPGQTGRSVATRPEELHGRLEYNERLLAACALLPADKAALLQKPLLHISEWMDLSNHIYAEIARDRDHALEGWVESGHVVQLIQLGGREIPETDLTAQQREVLPAMLEAGLVTARPARMSRQEAWQRGAKDLIKLPGWGVVAILGDDLAQEVTVRGNEIEITDTEIDPDRPLRFEPFITTATGAIAQLTNGEKYQAFVNPFAPDKLFLRDARGAYLGESVRILTPSRADVDAVHRAIGAAVKREAELLAPMRARHAKHASARGARHQHNAGVIAAAGIAEAKAETERNQTATTVLLQRERADEDEEI